MNNLSFSFIIPVYNRPDEIEELLLSFTNQNNKTPFEIVIIEDGSVNLSDKIVVRYSSQLNISYYQKNNSGPGDSRNFGMDKAKGNYFIILDSDCILPKDYLSNLIISLEKTYVDCFGGIDDAHHSFSNFQKAVNFSMTSFITTGGVRGSVKNKKNFQARSFNMGISKKAYDITKGFGNIHPGEDPDLSLRIAKLDLSVRLFENVKVFHKRRVNIKAFFTQVYKFGSVRPIINKWHPESIKFVFWLPSFILFYFTLSIYLLIFDIYIPFYSIVLYYILVFLSSLFVYKNIIIAFYSIITSIVQTVGYGIGFIKSKIKLFLFSNKDIEKLFPKYFFKN